MKKHLTKIMLTLLLCWCLKPGSILAQPCNTYNFSTYNTPYQPITGGTVIPMAALDLNSANSTSSINIGFPFKHNGTYFSQLKVNLHGFITFSTAIGGAQQYPFNSSGGITMAIGGLACPIAPGNSQHATSEMRVETIGSSPNRIFVAQWKDVRPSPTAFPNGDTLNFQIRLFETSNRVETHYGKITLSALYTSYPQVGLSGGNGGQMSLQLTDESAFPIVNAFWGDSLYVANNQNNWCELTGTSYCATVSIPNGGMKPDNGRKYIWEDPLPCSGTPNLAGSVVTLVDAFFVPTDSMCPLPIGSSSGFSQIFLALTQFTNATGYTFQWQSSYNNTTWSNIPGLVGYQPPGASFTGTATTYFRCLVSCGSFTAASPVKTLVVPVPTGTCMASQYSVCAGGANVLFTAKNTQGNGGNTNYLDLNSAYKWQTSNDNINWLNGVNQDSYFGFVTPVKYYRTIISCGIHSFTTNVITINAYPNTTSVTSTYANVCAGQTNTLTGLGAVSYSWSNGNTGANNQVNPTVPTTYTLYATDQYSCVNEKTVSVGISPPITVSVATTNSVICVGSSATLTGIGGTTYTWLPSGQVGGSVVVSPSVNTTYSVTGFANGCSNNASFIQFTQPTPTVNIIPSQTICIANNSPALFSLTVTSQGNSFLWMPGGYTQNNLFIQTPTVTTTYTVDVTSSIGCKTTTYTTVTRDPCTGLIDNTINANSALVYPNPTTDVINIVFVQNTGNNQNTIEIFDGSGRLVSRTNLYNAENAIDVRELAKGLYTYKIVSADKNLVKYGKIVKE
jgi:hypothetical protein